MLGNGIWLGKQLSGPWAGVVWFLSPRKGSSRVFQLFVCGKRVRNVKEFSGSRLGAQGCKGDAAWRQGTARAARRTWVYVCSLQSWARQL